VACPTLPPPHPCSTDQIATIIVVSFDSWNRHDRTSNVPSLRTKHTSWNFHGAESRCWKIPSQTLTCRHGWAVSGCPVTGIMGTYTHSWTHSESPGKAEVSSRPYPPKNSPRYPLDKRHEGLQSRCGRFGEREHTLHLMRVERKIARGQRET